MKNFGFKKSKKQGISKQAWADWLSDEPPSPAVQQEARRESVARANQYQARRPVAPPPVQPQQQQTVQPQLQMPPPAQHKPPDRPQPPATVSIQINLPGFTGERFKRFKHNLKTKPRSWWQWVRTFMGEHRKQSIIGTVVVAVVMLGVFIPPLLFGKTANQAKQSGAAGSSSTGAATAGYDKPPFAVVAPSSKQKLATPDGTHSTYDGKKNVYSFSDSLKGNGIIVSQQPIPAQFKDGPEAASKIAGQLTTSVSKSDTIETLFGPAYVVTNTKYNSQSVVTNIRDLLVFLQSSHSFSSSDWIQYINALQ